MEAGRFWKMSVNKLQKHVWELKNKERDFSIKWSILKRVSPRTAGRSKCNLCLEEKLCILESDSALTLSKRSELFSKCRHRYMFSASLSLRLYFINRA